MLFTSHGLTFNFTMTACANPDCPCKDTTFRFHESEANGNLVKGGHSFQVKADLVTGKESRTLPPARIGSSPW